MGLAVVTGGAGFIGSHLAAALRARGGRVRVVDDLSTGHRANLDRIGGCEFLEGDLADFGVARRAVEGAEVVFHQAAIPSVPRSIEDPLLAHASGPTAALHVLEAARREGGVRRVVFAASSSAYGDSDRLPKSEGMPPRPLSPYAAGKLAGEHYVHAYARTMGPDGVSLRYFNVFGPGQDPSSPYSGVISLFARSMREGRRPTIRGDGLQTRDFTYVDNAVAANLLAADAPGPLGGAAFNVGTGRRVSLLGLVAAINAILGTALEPEFLPARAGDVRDSQADLAAIRAALGYEPLVDFEEGLRRTLAAT